MKRSFEFQKTSWYHIYLIPNLHIIYVPKTITRFACGTPKQLSKDDGSIGQIGGTFLFVEEEGM